MSIPAPWTNADEAGLVALRNAPIEMADTSYGWFLATQKRDAERAYQWRTWNQSIVLVAIAMMAVAATEIVK